MYAWNITHITSLDIHIYCNYCYILCSTCNVFCAITHYKGVLLLQRHGVYLRERVLRTKHCVLYGV